ncbi:hypothetical protein Dimus_007868 [Dionaea muscipula]
MSVKSKVRGVDLEFDNEKSATILGVPGKMEYVNISRKCGKNPNIPNPLRSPHLPHHVQPTVEDGIWWIGSGENRRRDDDEAAPEEEAEGEDEGNQVDFDWEAVIDEATVEGESGSGEKFYDAEEEAQGSPELPEEIPADATPRSAQQKDKGIAGVDPSGPTSREADFLKFQAEFERKRANKFHDELEKAKAENAKLLALLHQAQTKPHP